MRAILCKEYGPADKLVIEDITCPDPEGRNVKVRVKAAGLNFPDTLIIEGKYQIKPEMPFSPGGEMAGEVISVGDKVTRFKAGDRVIGMTGYGAFAEEMLVEESRLLPLPEGMSFEEGSAFSMVYGTSYHALKQRANIQPGESLLVLGASGGVGLATVELGKAMGAHVIAAASTDEKLEVARKAGADELLNYGNLDKPLKDVIKEMTGGRGVDVIYDPVGGDYTEQALRAMAWNGRHLIIGFAAGQIPKIPANLTLLKSCSVVGVFWGAFTKQEPDVHEQNMVDLMKLFAEGKIKPSISEVFAFEDYEKALAALSGRKATGKVVLKVAD